MEITNNLRKNADYIRQFVKELPNNPGIYKMLSEHGDVLYVGKAKNLPKRVISYAKIDDLPNRLRRMVAQLAKIEYILTKTEGEALLLEANLIKTLKPIYNISLRDDKSFPYILIENNHDFPRITKYRGNKGKSGSYFGPFSSAGLVNETLAELQKIFLLRPCSDNFFNTRNRPCLQHQIKRCSAPCVGKINKDDYQQQIKNAKEFLSGKSKDVQNRLISEMEKLSLEMKYEQAGLIRDRIKILSQIQAKNIFSNSSIDDADIICLYNNNIGDICIEIGFIRGGKHFGNKSYFQHEVFDQSDEELLEVFIGQFYQFNQPPQSIYINLELSNSKELMIALQSLTNYKVDISTPKLGNKKELVNHLIENAKESLNQKLKTRIKFAQNFTDVAKLFHIDHSISRIEVYDNSHNFGEYAVGCMVVVGSDGFLKNDYRKYNIKSTEIGDDYTMLKEVLRRRLSKLTPHNKPDLMLIDGGKGHLSAAEEVFKELGITDIRFVCISKGEDRNAGREYFHIIDQKAFQLPRNSSTLHFLQNIRNEVHRFAIESHRLKRSQDIRKSSLDNIPGIGPKRKKLLLSHFGSVEAIKSASTSDLAKIAGISTQQAEKVIQYI